MRKAVYLGLIAVLIAGSVAAGGCSKESPEDQLKRVFSNTAVVRQLSPEGDIEWEFVTPEEMRAKLMLIFEEGYSSADAEIDAEVYVILDLIDEGENLYEMLLDVYSEQVVGYYEEEAKRLYVVTEEASLGPMEKLTLAHEYTHALQDQHFDLGSLPLDSEDNSDAALAALALVEGDATLVLGMYLWQVLTSAERDAYLEEAEETDTSVLEAAPPVIQEGLLFPYQAGLEFVMEIYEYGGQQAVDQAFDDPPRSTEQILHPDKYYLYPDDPQEVSMPDLESVLGAQWVQLDTDVMGELSMRIYLDTFVDGAKAGAAAMGWDGDRYVYLKDGEGRKVFALQTVWDGTGDATGFFNTYIDFMEEKEGTRQLTLDGVERKRWESDEMSVFLGKTGSEVLVVMAPDNATLGQILTSFPGF